MGGSLTRPCPGAYTLGKTSSVVFRSSLYFTYQNWIIYIIYICMTFNNERKLIAHVVSLAVIVLRLSDHFKRLKVKLRVKWKSGWVYPSLSFSKNLFNLKLHYKSTIWCKSPCKTIFWLCINGSWFICNPLAIQCVTFHH